MHRWPAAPNAEAMIPSTVLSITASGITTMWFFAPAERLHPLARLRRALVHDPRHRRRPHERHRVDPPVIEDRLHHLTAAVHQIHDPRRQPQRVQLLERDLLRQRHLLGRFEHERVPAGDRERQEPERHHRREVERNDRRAHPHRLTDRLRVDIPRDVLEDPALHRRRDRARSLDHLDHPRHLRASVPDRLAHLGRDRHRQILLTRHQPLTQLEQLPRPRDRRHPPPLRQRLTRRPHRDVQISPPRQGHTREHLPVSRVQHVEHVGRGLRRRPLAVDVVVKKAGCCYCHRGSIHGRGR